MTRPEESPQTPEVTPPLPVPSQTKTRRAAQINQQERKTLTLRLLFVASMLVGT